MDLMVTTVKCLVTSTWYQVRAWYKYWYLEDILKMDVCFSSSPFLRLEDDAPTFVVKQKDFLGLQD